MRGRLLRWLGSQNVHPRIIGEFDDSALMQAFAQAGSGIFPAPALIADDLCRQHGMRCIGQVEAVTERVYAISVERRLSHPAVLAILQAASQGLFAVEEVITDDQGGA